MKYLKSINLKIESCVKCPHHTTERTMGAGFAHDFLCTMKRDKDGEYKMIVGYVEWPSEEPQKGQIPTWCPFRSKKQSK